MKKLVIALALATAPLAGCAAVNTALQPTPIAGQTAIDEKALVAAEALYNVPAQAYVTLDAKGQLPAATKAQLKPIMVKAYDALLAVRQAYKVGNVATFNARVSALRDLSNQARRLLPNSGSS